MNTSGHFGHYGHLLTPGLTRACARGCATDSYMQVSKVSKVSTQAVGMRS